MFESIGGKIQKVFSKLRGFGTLNEKQVDEALADLRLLFLEADVHGDAIRAFSSRVREAAVQDKVLKSLTPGQHVVKIVRDELIALFGGTTKRLRLERGGRMQTLLLAGLQGSGKTTTAGKLALHLKKQGYFPYLVPCDLARPAAVEQLQTIGAAVGIEVFGDVAAGSALETAKKALRFADTRVYNAVIFDSAGRLHVDEALMQELQKIQALVKPVETLYVMDAMTGQDGLHSAKAFHETLRLTGAVLTKMDGDAKGGAALSMAEATGVPVVFIGTGEKYEDFETFHPDRMASRLLGMGDVLTLIESAEAGASEEAKKKALKNLKKGTFTLEDFRDQLRQMRSGGMMEKMMDLMPGMAAQKDALRSRLNEKELVHFEAVIDSMTPVERLRPSLINGSRKRRICRGAGVPAMTVSRLLKRHGRARRMMKKLKGGKIPAGLGALMGKRGM